MSHLNRREFIQRSAGALGITWAASALGQPQAATAPFAATKRALGNTGCTATLLGMGTGTRGGGGKSDQNRQGREAFVKTLIHAYERGLRYYDMANQYGAHDYFKDAHRQAGMKREELFLLTKSNATTAEAMTSDVDRFRTEIDTDYLDVVLLHCMTDPDWPEKMKPCMDALAEAKSKGIIRAHGVSCHSIEALKRAAENPWVEVLLARINPFGLRMDAPPEEVLPVLKQAHAAGKGMLGMKILGEGEAADRMDESLKYVLSTGIIHAITIGFVKPEEIDEVIQRLEACRNIAV